MKSLPEMAVSENEPRNYHYMSQRRDNNKAEVALADNGSYHHYEQPDIS